MANTNTLIYVHDPMCSWCWGFRPTLRQLRSSLAKNIQFTSLLGGLAEDSDQDMSEEMKIALEATWHRIAQQLPATTFNHDFWRTAKPRRSTYPACRAVLATRAMQPDLEDNMILAIQDAYYTQALNPSDNSTLIQLATKIGLHENQFEAMLKSDAIHQTLVTEINHARQIGAQSFPALILQTGENSYQPVSVDYTNAQNMLNTIKKLSHI